MKTTTITALFVASVILIGIGGAASPAAYANHPVLIGDVDGMVSGDGQLSFWKIFSGFAWWGAEETLEPRTTSFVFIDEINNIHE